MTKFAPELRKLKNIVTACIWVLLGLFFALLLLPQIPFFQKKLGSYASTALSEKLGTRAEVGRVTFGLPSRVIIDDVLIFDQQADSMLRATRVSAKCDLSALARGKIVISSAQLFGLDARLKKANAEAKPNYQFVLDSLSNPNSDKKKPFDLKISSLVIRRGKVSYDRLDQPYNSLKFTPHHIAATGISGHIALQALTNDSLNLNVKNFACQEHSGLNMKSMSFQLISNKKKAVIKDFVAKLPHSHINIPSVTLGKEISASVHPSTEIAPRDLAFLVPSLADIGDVCKLHFQLEGDSSVLRLHNVNFATEGRDAVIAGDMAVGNYRTKPLLKANVRQLDLQPSALEKIAAISSDAKSVIQSVGITQMAYQGSLAAGAGRLMANGNVTTDAGEAKLTFDKKDRDFSGHLKTEGLNIGTIAKNKQLGELVADIDFSGKMGPQQLAAIQLKGDIPTFEYNGYAVKNIRVDGQYDRETFDGFLAVEDPNADLELNGKARLGKQQPAADLTAQVKRLNPALISTLTAGKAISSAAKDQTYSFNMKAQLTGNQINNLNGELHLSDFTLNGMPQADLQNTTVRMSSKGGMRALSVDGGFGTVDLQGDYDYLTLAKSITNIVRSKLPTMPLLPAASRQSPNDFSLKAHITHTDFLRNIFDIPLTIHEPLDLQARLNDKTNDIHLLAQLPSLTYDEKTYSQARLRINTQGDTLRTEAQVTKQYENGLPLQFSVKADAIDNHLAAAFDFDKLGKHPYSGTVNTDTRFFHTPNNKAAAQIDIHHSEILFGDTAWTLQPATIVYSDKNLLFDHLAIQHGEQFAIIDGKATTSPDDTLQLQLQNINVAYILDLVGFHSVDFSGEASGRATINSLLGPSSAWDAKADLTVKNFKFENGRMGTLDAHARYNTAEQQIDINAQAIDTPASSTLVSGYISPARSYIDLDIQALNTRAEFAKSFCSSFMDDIDAHATGRLRLYGPLSNINLVGQLVANGDMSIEPINTDYHVENAVINFIPDNIIFVNDTLRDRNGNLGIVTGGLHHDHLTHLTYDIHIGANNLLAYDFTTFGDMPFCGTVYATGTCNIRGGDGRTDIDADFTPEANSIFTYNASNPDAILTQEFIQWKAGSERLSIENNAQEAQPNTQKPKTEKEDEDESPSDLYMNFIINATPDATLRVLMDQQAGDDIRLHGNGTLRASYYNKGAFEMYGNYNVERGTYNLSIQNVISKLFRFQPNSVIAFRGDPYQADLNLKALYTVNGVSLADLKLGKTFSNNIRVDCLMNITGSPAQPRVDFNLDLPTVGNEVKQMIFNIINSQEEMNQQALFLLTIGCFYTQQNNNNSFAQNSPTQPSQTSLAMQSILSGTISAQLNNILSSVVKNQNWHLGANISTGDEGFNNAEYEGLLSGSLLNNRLLINGQFGYRDNQNATTSFIGDFDIRYLLQPNGNIALKVYNQTNDRYFTPNSLNTQGVGLVLKKDFNSLSDLLKGKDKH